MRYTLLIGWMIATAAIATDTTMHLHALKEACGRHQVQACIKAAQATGAKRAATAQEQQRNASEAARLYKQACRLGDAKACTEYAMRFYADTLRDRNETDTDYFKKGCEGGDERACTLEKMAAYAKRPAP